MLERVWRKGNHFTLLVGMQTSTATEEKSVEIPSVGSVQSLSHVQIFVTPWTAAHQTSLSISQLPELAQTTVLWVGDAIQWSHRLPSPSPPAFNLSQHQGLFQWVSSLTDSGGQSIGVSTSASVLPMNIQDWFPLGLTGLILQSKGLSRVLPNTTVQNH